MKHRLIKRIATDVSLDEKIDKFSAWFADRCVSTFDDYDGLRTSLFDKADVDCEFMYELMTDCMDTSSIKFFFDLDEFADYMLAHPDADFWQDEDIDGPDNVEADEIVDYIYRVYGTRTAWLVVNINTNSIINRGSDDDSEQCQEMAAADYPGLAQAVANYFKSGVDKIAQFRKLSEAAKQYGYNEDN
jgi:hypothetical protein